jgi:hypothetical protein
MSKMKNVLLVLMLILASMNTVSAKGVAGHGVAHATVVGHSTSHGSPTNHFSHDNKKGLTKQESVAVFITFLIASAFGITAIRYSDK